MRIGIAMNIDGVSEMVWKRCFRLKRNEKALVVSDARTKTDPRYEISRSLWWTGRKLCSDCALILMKKTGMSGREPSPEVAKAMLGYAAVVAPTEHSITHTSATLKAAKAGCRIATMPGVTGDMYLRAVAIDYARMGLWIERLEAKMHGREFHITTKAGTDLYLYRNGRKLCSDNGMIARRGKIGNLPAGEVAFAPMENKSEGVLVVDLSSFRGRVRKPFRIKIEKGHAVDCSDSGLWKALSSAINGTNVAELGIGTNPRARITGSILEDEKVMGTAHVAFGTSKDLGGKVQTSIHLDNVFSRPSIEMDGKRIITSGKV